MRVTDKTQYIDFEPFLSCLDEDGVEELKKAAQRKYGNMYALTLAQFFACSEGDFSHIGVTDDLPTFWQALLVRLHLKKWGLTVLQYYWVVRFREWVDEFTQSVRALTPPQSPEAKKACVGCFDVDYKENMLVFMRQYFGLHSFREAEQMKISDFLIAKKDVYNKAVFESNYSKQHKIKAKK